MKGHHFSQQLALGKYAWPGGYPRYLVLTSGECMCMDCARKEEKYIRHAAMTPSTNNGWTPHAFDINWESDTNCDECGEAIERAYYE